MIPLHPERPVLASFEMKSCRSTLMRKLFKLIFTESDPRHSEILQPQVAKHPSNIHRGELKTLKQAKTIQIEGSQVMQKERDPNTSTPWQKSILSLLV